jgi:hypothetical protein
MKVSLLHYSVHPVLGEVESVMANHAQLISANGHFVQFIVPCGNLYPLADSRHERVNLIKQELDKGNICKL